jgi:methyltransferase
MNLILFVTGLVFGLMLAEARVSRRHEALLRERGAVRPEGDVYRALALLYPAAFLVMSLEGLWRAVSAQTPASPAAPSWFASGLLLFAASKVLKYWAIASLGERWTFRVIVVPGAPLVATGPYRFIAHPNYVAVIGELAGAAMMVGARVSAVVMIAAFGVALWARIRFENGVLRSAMSRQ